MAIMSDRWIKQQCMKPTHIKLQPCGKAEFIISGVTHAEEYVEMACLQSRMFPATDEILEQHGWEPMISPFVDTQVRERDKVIGEFDDGVQVHKQMDTERIVSYGVSSYGYDVRLADTFKIFTNINNAVIDPLNPSDDCFVDHKGDYCIIPPNSYILGHTIETFSIPNDVLVIAVGKSTYARLAAIVNVTPIEPGFKGQVVIEIANASTLPLKVYANQGIAQFLFFQGNEPCEVSYADKGGKYQNQHGLTTARL